MKNLETKSRSAAECGLFAISFFGILLGVAGVVAASAGVAVCGLLAAALAASGFLLKQSVDE